jgi:hypothetical protein
MTAIKDIHADQTYSQISRDETRTGLRDLAMTKTKVVAMTMFAFFTLSVSVTPAHAGESYFYAGTSSFTAEFYLIGGQYSLYLYAKRPVTGYVSPESKSCIFGGNLQRVSPTQDAMSLGAGITISTIVPHKIGPAPLTMPAGLYRLYIAPLTDCDWHFNLESTNQNTAGVAPVQMYNVTKGTAHPSLTASVTDLVEFYAQYRTEHDVQVPASGEVQIMNGGKVVQRFPLQVGTDEVTKATVFYLHVQWDQSDTQYLGKNTARFVVKIGSQEFTTIGEFTLTK